jgi:neurofibromin 1
MSNIAGSGDLKGDKAGPSLLQGRAQLEEAALPLDDAYGVKFTHENFDFAVCACIVRGLTDTMTRSTALRLLSAFLEMIGSSGGSAEVRPANISRSPYMALILARCTGHDELKEDLWFAGLDPSSFDHAVGIRGLQDLGATKDKDLLLNTAIELVDFQYLEDAVQNRSLQWLNELVSVRPGVVMHL